MSPLPHPPLSDYTHLAPLPFPLATTTLFPVWIMHINSLANPFTLFHPVPSSPLSSDNCHSVHFWWLFTHRDSIFNVTGWWGCAPPERLVRGTHVASRFLCSSRPSLSPSQRLLPFDCFSLKSTLSSRVLLRSLSRCCRSLFLRTTTRKVSPEIAGLLPSSDFRELIGGERGKVLSICGDCTDTVSGIWIKKWRKLFIKV